MDGQQHKQKLDATLRLVHYSWSAVKYTGPPRLELGTRIPFQIALLGKLGVDGLKVLEEAGKDLDAQPRVERPARGADRVHRQLRHARVNRAAAHRRAEHRPDCAAAARVVADLEHLQRVAALFGDALEQRRRDRVGRHLSRWSAVAHAAVRGAAHVSVRIGGDGDAHVEPGSVVLEIGAQEVGVDGVRNVCRQQEAVGVRLVDDVLRLPNQRYGRPRAPRG